MNRTRIHLAAWVIGAAGLAAAPVAMGQANGQGPPPAYVPPKMSMPKPYVPPAPMSAVGKPGRPPPYSIPPRTGSGLTRPLPLNFGGVRAKMPGPIGSLKQPPTTTNPWPAPRSNPGGDRQGGGAAIIVTDRSGDTRVVGRGELGPSQGGYPAPTPEPGFSGHIGTSGVSVGYSTGGSSSGGSGSGFSFTTNINNSSNVRVSNRAIWLTPGRYSMCGQWGYRNPYSWGRGWGYESYGYPIYSPIWPYPDPMLSSYYTPAAPVAQPDPAVTAQAPLTVLEQAELLMGAERYSEAVAGFREHLAQKPDDAETLRMLGVTLLLDRRPREAGEAMLAAYRMNPMLADSPVVLPMGLGPSDLAVAANRAIEYAQRTRTAPSWLSAAVMSQARDKLPVARNFVKSAKAAGLDAEVYARLMSSWST